MPTSEAMRRKSSETLFVIQRVTPNTSSYQASSASMSSLMWMRWKFLPMVNTRAICCP